MALDSFTISAIVVSVAAVAAVFTLYARAAQNKCNPDA